jgi:hypothetical protein
MAEFMPALVLPDTDYILRARERRGPFDQRIRARAQDAIDFMQLRGMDADPEFRLDPFYRQLVRKLFWIGPEAIQY